MSSRRLSIGLILAAALAADASAQFGNPLKKVMPQKPAPPAPAAPARPPFCHGITDQDIDNFLKGKKKQKELLDQIQQQAAQRKAQEDANAQKRGEALMEGIDRLNKCEDAAREKHPKYQEHIRVGNLANAAYDRGDQAGGDRYNAQATELADLIDAAVNKACDSLRPNMFGTGAVAEEAARDQQLLIEYGKCTEAAQKAGKDPNKECPFPALGQGAATKAAQEQQAAGDRALREARNDVDRKSAEAAGMDGSEWGRINECIAGRLNNPAATPSTPESNEAIDKRAAELRAATGQ